MELFETYFWRFTIQPANSETITCGMHECIPYENVVPFSIQQAVFVTEGCGTHQCVPSMRSLRVVRHFCIQQKVSVIVGHKYPISFHIFFPLGKSYLRGHSSKILKIPGKFSKMLCISVSM